jgi:hypothetical protein
VSTPAASWPVKAYRIWLHEMKTLVPPTIYFFCAFNVISFTTNLMVKPYWFALTNFLVASGLALLVGKVVLVVGKFRVIDRFRDAPLIKPILYKTIFYSVMVLIARVLERLTLFAFDADGFGPAFREAIEVFTWRRFAAIQIWLFICFFVYVGAREFAHTLGEERLVDLLFRRRRPRAD